MIKAIIFDMDGVIVDSEPCALENRLAYFRQLGIESDARKLARL
ncbi:MAG: HAD family phosphatase, partial [Lacticaseibacillus paracasei]|nr:HAD family phosphatase [Lacticaseibacillus paracasei]